MSVERKKVEVPISTPAGPAVLTFQRLTLKQEQEYREWLRAYLRDDALSALKSSSNIFQHQTMAEFLKTTGGGACSLTGDVGIANAVQGAGLRKFLMLAGAEHHPDMDEEAVYELLNDYYEPLLNVVMELLPVSINNKAGKGHDPNVGSPR